MREISDIAFISRFWGQVLHALRLPSGFNHREPVPFLARQPGFPPLEHFKLAVPPQVLFSHRLQFFPRLRRHDMTCGATPGLQLTTHWQPPRPLCCQAATLFSPMSLPRCSPVQLLTLNVNCLLPTARASCPRRGNDGQHPPSAWLSGGLTYGPFPYRLSTRSPVNARICVAGVLCLTYPVVTTFAVAAALLLPAFPAAAMLQTPQFPLNSQVVPLPSLWLSLPPSYRYNAPESPLTSQQQRLACPKSWLPLTCCWQSTSFQAASPNLVGAVHLPRLAPPCCLNTSSIAAVRYGYGCLQVMLDYSQQTLK